MACAIGYGKIKGIATALTEPIEIATDDVFGLIKYKSLEIGIFEERLLRQNALLNQLRIFDAFLDTLVFLGQLLRPFLYLLLEYFGVEFQVGEFFGNHGIVAFLLYVCPVVVVQGVVVNYYKKVGFFAKEDFFDGIVINALQVG